MCGTDDLGLHHPRAGRQTPELPVAIAALELRLRVGRQRGELRAPALIRDQARPLEHDGDFGLPYV